MRKGRFRPIQYYRVIHNTATSGCLAKTRQSCLVCHPLSVLAVLPVVQQVMKQCHRIFFPCCATPCYREKAASLPGWTLYYCTTWTRVCQFILLWIVRVDHILMLLCYMLYQLIAFKHPVQHHHANRKLLENCVPKIRTVCWFGLCFVWGLLFLFFFNMYVYRRKRWHV